MSLVGKFAKLLRISVTIFFFFLLYHIIIIIFPEKNQDGYEPTYHIKIIKIIV